MSGNQALNINYGVAPDADLEITNHGSDWYFTVCAIMGAATLVFVGLAFTKPRTHRLFNYLAASITLVAAIDYFTLGAGLGQVPINAEFVRPNSAVTYAAGTREIFYTRYIDYFITTPLILTSLFLTAGLLPVNFIVTLVADEVMVVCYLIAALTDTSYKWGYWTFGVVAYLYVAFSVLTEGRTSAVGIAAHVGRTYTILGSLTVFIWFLYPIAFGLSEGGNVIHPDSEAIFYGILDIFSKVVFGFLLVFGHNSIEPADLGLGAGLASRGGAFHEKTSNGHHNGVNTAGTTAETV